MKLQNFYFEQLVGETDMDGLQANTEAAIGRIMSDQAYFGVTTGYDVVQHTPVPNLSVDIGGPGIAYDQLGRRVYMSGSVNLSLSTDSNGVPTGVTSSGNQKWLSIFAQFTRVQSDQRFDGNSLPILYIQDEGCQFIVTQGAESTSGTAARPALMSDAILIADVLLSYGTTQILNSAIESSNVTAKPNSRFQYVFDLRDSSPAKVRTGRLPDAMQYLLDQLNSHIVGTIGVHPGTALTNTLVPPSGAPWNSVELGANLSEGIDGIMHDLTSGDGAYHIGTQMVRKNGLSSLLPLNVFFDGNVQEALEEIVEKFVICENIDDSVAPFYQTTNSGANHRAIYRRPTPNGGGIRLYTHDTIGFNTAINLYWDAAAARWKAAASSTSVDGIRYGTLKAGVGSDPVDPGSMFGLVAVNPTLTPAGFTEENFLDPTMAGGFIFPIRSPQKGGNLVRIGDGSSNLNRVGFNFVYDVAATNRQYDIGFSAADTTNASAYFASVTFPGDFGSTPSGVGIATYVSTNVDSVTVLSTCRVSGILVIDKTVSSNPSHYLGSVSYSP